MDGEGAPLDGGCVEVPVLDVEVPGAHRLGPQAVEQGNFGSAGDANCWEENEEGLNLCR